MKTSSFCFPVKQLPPLPLAVNANRLVIASERAPVLLTNHFRADGYNLMVNKRGLCPSKYVKCQQLLAITACWQPSIWHSFAHRERNEKIACHERVWAPGVPQKNFIGEAPPRGLIPYPVYTIFDRKGILFVYLLWINVTPSTNLVWRFLFLWTAVNVLPLKYEHITKQEL